MKRSIHLKLMRKSVVETRTPRDKARWEQLAQEAKEAEKRFEDMPLSKSQSSSWHRILVQNPELERAWSEMIKAKNRLYMYIGSTY
jgi:hypothetical protein